MSLLHTEHTLSIVMSYCKNIPQIKLIESKERFLSIESLKKIK